MTPRVYSIGCDTCGKDFMIDGDVIAMPTREDLDRLAMNDGWSVAYGKHKCPTCQFREGKLIAAGALRP